MWTMQIWCYSYRKAKMAWCNVRPAGHNTEPYTYPTKDEAWAELQHLYPDTVGTELRAFHVGDDYARH